ncbi:lipopolysaccharide-induced tumor necrosis factor-alpha factor homolog [Haliotis rubra]|uniref:lipopolysaccharide-induced tumor necrosis factor-alpha factor homolog n=1 Tax=Haliotis rubra TaxID=36100 RepID=UPI001EE5B476|nr:lipopolysaccharide-induced tumor necrosis factor-alpha factor homolog [Haliotis rubra]
MASGMAYGDPANPSQASYGAPVSYGNPTNPSQATYGAPMTYGNPANPPPAGHNSVHPSQAGGFIPMMPGILMTNDNPPKPLCLMRMGEAPVSMRCYYCHTDVMTSTRYKFGMCTCLCMLLIFMLGGILGCFLIPLWINKTKDVIHTCPNCKNQIGCHRK